MHMIGALISPSASVQKVLCAGRHVLFCAEGDAALARSCLEVPKPPITQTQAQPNRLITRSGGVQEVHSYMAFMQLAIEQGEMTSEDAAWAWAQGWPTELPVGSRLTDSPDEVNHGGVGRGN